MQSPSALLPQLQRPHIPLPQQLRPAAPLPPPALPVLMPQPGLPEAAAPSGSLAQLLDKGEDMPAEERYEAYEQWNKKFSTAEAEHSSVLRMMQKLEEQLDAQRKKLEDNTKEVL